MKQNIGKGLTFLMLTAVAIFLASVAVINGQEYQREERRQGDNSRITAPAEEAWPIGTVAVPGPVYGAQYRHLKVSLPEGDFKPLRQHINNAAASRSWLVLSSRPDGADLLMPPGDYPDLRKVADDPYRWVEEQAENTKPTSTAEGWQDRNPVRVTIDLQHSGWTPLRWTAVLAELAAAGTLAALPLVDLNARSRRQGQTAAGAGAAAGPPTDAGGDRTI